jgi:Kdo2-lipid IVA lauroyltransferase/acyltransferase
MVLPMPRPPLNWPAALLYASLRVFGALPLRAVLALGAVLGRLAWALRGRSRRIAERNLALVLTQDSAKNRQAVAKRCVIDTGRSAVEILATWGGGAERALRRVVEVRGQALFDNARAQGRGVIVAAPHLGCWELLNYWLATQQPLAILYRPPRRAWIEPVLRRVRGALPVEQIRAEGSGVRALYKRLAAGGMVGILPDQQPRAGEGIDAPFFGVPAPTMVLLPRLAERTGAQVVFAFAERLPHGAGYRLHFLPAPVGIANADTSVACAALNRGVEDCVRLAFTQYQWTYKRWPASARPRSTD